MNVPSSTKTNQKLSNMVSYDFPLYHSEYVPVYKSCERGNRRNNNRNIAGTYSNEHPEFFRLSCMKEGGTYHNKYLDDVIKVDRAEEYKCLDFKRKQLNLIDYIKSNRKLSQDTKVLGYIRNIYDIEVEKKRNNKFNRNNININNNDNKSNSICYTNAADLSKNNNEYNNICCGPEKVSYKITPIIDKSKPFLYIKKEPEKAPKSSYMCNLNDYSISEAENRDKTKECFVNLLPSIAYNCVKDKVEEIERPKMRVEKWPSFYKNYLLIGNTKGGYKRKGGLFSEFSDKNITFINVGMREVRERVRKEKEMRMKRFSEISKNNNNNKRVIYEFNKE